MLAIVAASMTTGACQRDETKQNADPKLAALKAEPLARFMPPRAELEHQLELAEESFYKPTIAQVVRLFAFPTARLAAKGRDAVIEVAVSSGWRLNLARDEPGRPLFGGKRLPTGDATLIIGKYVDRGINKVSVWLEHQPCTKARCGRG